MKKHYARFVLVVFLLVCPTLLGAEVGDTYRSDTSHTYILQKKFGGGHFGSVFQVRNLSTQEKHAAKFFVPEILEQSVLDTYSRISELQDQGRLTHLIRVYRPEVFAPIEAAQPGKVHVVRTEIGQGNLEKYETISFSLRHAKNAAARISCMVRAHDVMEDVLAGIVELKSAGLNHHDLNPRNILWTGGSYYKIADLDEVLPHGRRPRYNAFEARVAPLAYTLENYHFNDDNISDVHQLAQTLYKLLFGEYRLDLILKRQGVHSDVHSLRSELNQLRSLASFDADLGDDLDCFLGRYFANLSSVTDAERTAIVEVFAFLHAALRMDYELRADALSRLPFMREFKLGAWRLGSIRHAEQTGTVEGSETGLARCIVSIIKGVTDIFRK